LLGRIGDEGLLLDIGSGNCRWSQNTVNLDIEIFPNVDVIADGKALPFREGVFDAVVSEAVLEHVSQPEMVIEEIWRVTKPGGYVGVAVPFIQAYHASPHDYQRYTLMGLETALSRFVKVESGACVGPASALHWVMREFVGICFSFGSLWLGKAVSLLFGWLTFPMVLIDPLLLRLPNSHLIASAIYYVGRKQGSSNEM
jgi:SAM-dependent methyltransferase